MSKVKNQHYVPRIYLENFAVKSKVFVFDKIEERILSSNGTNVKNIASERYFYDLPVEVIPDDLKDHIDVQLIEKWFSKIEIEFSKALNSIIATFALSTPENLYFTNALSEKEKFDVASFLAIQDLRTRDFRDSILETNEKLTKALLNRFGVKAKSVIEKEIGYIKIQENLKGEVEVLIDEKVRERELLISHIKSLLDKTYLQKFTEVLFNHIWIIGINRSSLPLWTSDNPLVRRAWKEGETGFASEGIEVAFPVNPKLILIMCDKSYYRCMQSLNRRFLNLQENEVVYYNNLQVSNSNRQLYSINNNFELAAKACSDYPEIKARNRWRVD